MRPFVGTCKFDLDCGQFAINRFAADDDNEAIVAIYQNSLRLDGHTHCLLVENGITLLGDADQSIVR
jgi:hypothetical protein